MTDTSSITDSSAGRRHVELNDLQLAWLAEIGLERRILARYRPARTPGALLQDSTSTAAIPAQDKAQGLAQTPGGHAQAGGSHAPEDGTHRADRTGSELARMALKQARMPQGRRRAAPSVSHGLQAVGMHLVTSQGLRSQDMPADWAGLGAHAEACQACGLQVQRDQLVFGAGDTDQPDWLIVGEAPGKADDRTGFPFQGKAGKLLHAMLVSVGAHPASFALGSEPQPIPGWSQPAPMYFSNLIKCRPLGNRSPTPAEIASCAPYLMQQIEMLQPRRILALGRLAAQALLRVDADIEDLRGQVHQLTTASGKTIPLVVTWHPAALLMHPQNKGQAWIDMNLASRL